MREPPAAARGFREKRQRLELGTKPATQSASHQPFGRQWEPRSPWKDEEGISIKTGILVGRIKEIN